MLGHDMLASQQPSTTSNREEGIYTRIHCLDRPCESMRRAMMILMTAERVSDADPPSDTPRVISNRDASPSWFSGFLCNKPTRWRRGHRVAIM